MSTPLDEITTRSKVKQIQKQSQRRGSTSGAAAAVAQEKGTEASMESMTQALLKINKSLEALTKQSTENSRKLTDNSKKLTELTTRLDLNTTEIANNTESINRLVQESTETRKIAESARSTAEDTKERFVPIAKKVHEHDAALAFLELERKNKNLKLRSVPEEEVGNLGEFLTDKFQEFWTDELEGEEEFVITSAFRIGRKQGKKPRDCLISLRSKEERDKILDLHYKKALTVKNSQIQIFKDIPKLFLEIRLQYKTLTDLLKKHNIQFRWEYPQGLSFNFKGKKVKIKTTQDKDQFLERNFEDFQKGTVNEGEALDLGNLSFGLTPAPTDEEQELGAVGGKVPQ